MMQIDKALLIKIKEVMSSLINIQMIEIHFWLINQELVQILLKLKLVHQFVVRKY